MIQKNLTKVLLVVLAAGALLTAYNAFVNSNNDSETNASTKLANYLSIDRAKQAVEGAEDVVAGTDNQPTEEAAPATEEPATEAAPETTAPAAEEAMTSEAAPTPETAPAVTTTPSTATPGTDKVGTVYTVKEGDTYACIAEKYYGSLEHYVDIMAANPIYDTGFGEYSLFVDAQLVLPAISAANFKPASTACQ